jgi:Predicted metal-binding, possibly nucleic acid-binding protein
MRSADSHLPQEPFRLHLWRARYPAGLQTGGRLAAADLLRLGQAGLGLEADMVWAAQFQDNTLDITVEATLVAVCGRCLQSMTIPLGASRRFLCFDTAAAADEALDLEEETLETLSSEDDASLVSLCEDEALLAVGETPLHEACGLPLDRQPVAGAERIQPFAGLADLLQKK